MNCEVIISSSATEKEEGLTLVKGTVTQTENGFEIAYNLDGDDCQIIYDGATLKQTRSGSTPMEISFAKNEQTACVLKCAGGAGEIPVYTYILRVAETPDVKRIEIVYDLGDMNIRLEITAVRKYKEKK